MGASPDVVTRTPASVPVASDSRPINAGGSDQSDQDSDQSLYLIGRPPLKDFLRFVRNHAVKPLGETALTGAWQAAHAIVRQLETQEAGVADNPPIAKLGPEYEPLLIEFLKDPLVHNGFNTVPTEVAIVELDRMVVYQEHIDVSHSRRLEQQLGASPRAFTLRQMGVTHVPCIVQHVASRDELDVVASSSVRRNPDLYLKHTRPPMLKDYFNPQLRMVMPVHRRLRQVTVRIEVEEDFVPAL